jgi:hypothetical protein
VIDDGTDGLGSVTAAPIKRAKPIADLTGVLARFDAADTDHVTATGDSEGRLAVLAVDPGKKALGVVDAIGMRNARGILSDAAVVDETHDGFDVAAVRRAQRETLGFEHGDAALFWLLREDGRC